MLNAFLYGALLSLGLILPLGVQNIFLFNQGASQRSYRQALPAVVTAFCCDTLLIGAAVLGTSMLVLTMPSIQTLIYLFGMVFLSYMGWLLWRTETQFIGEAEPLPLKRQILFALSVSILNPHAILDTIGVIGASSLSFEGKEKLAFTVACLLVSLIWFLGLVYAGRCFKKLDRSGKGLSWVNKISALIMWGMACSLGWRLF